ncbi:ribbon-helix-helix protein, CopG family [archaeon]|jgi:metal-responsive CopG/Arc/MetJ family transcriptional regulator|nr:ribbon-helix-helix protein, CopG family [archaeon]
MKERLSVTVEDELISKLDEIMQKEEFRNKSHLVEVALKKYVLEDGE